MVSMTGTHTNYLLSIRAPDGGAAQRFRARLAGFLDEQARSGLIQDHRLGELEAVAGGDPPGPVARLVLCEEGYEAFAV